MTHFVSGDGRQYVYKKHKGVWITYEPAFLDLMKKREMEKRLDPEVIKGVKRVKPQ